METSIKIKVDFDGKVIGDYLNFISETKEGKFTQVKPEVTNITYSRLQIQEQDSQLNNDEVLLFGVSY